MSVKYWPLGLILGILLCAAPAMAGDAAPSPLPAGPGLVPAGQWRLSAGGTWQMSERFQDTNEHAHDSEGASFAGHSDNLKMRDDHFYMASLAYGLNRRLTLVAQAGMAQGGIMAETTNTGQWEAKLKPVFVWGLGAKGLLWETASGLGLTGGLSYLRYDDRKIDNWHHGSGYDTSSDGTLNVDGKMDYWRLEANLLVHQRLGRWLPYAGVSYTYSEIRDNDTWSYNDGYSITYDFQVTDKDRWGIPLGVQAQLTDHLGLVLSGTVLSREEVGLSLSWDF